MFVLLGAITTYLIIICMMVRSWLVNPEFVAATAVAFVFMTGGGILAMLRSKHGTPGH